MDSLDDRLGQPPRRAVDMSDAELEDFLDQMYLHAWEGGGGRLCAVPSAVDDFGVLKGPFHDSDEAAVFASWHRAGLVELWSHLPHGDIRAGTRLSDQRAAEVLAHPEMWDDSHEPFYEQVISVAVSPAGANRQWNDWVQAVDREVFERPGAQPSPPAHDE